MSTFNEAISYLRRRRGLKQAEIAEKIGVSSATWSDYERGKTQPNFDVLRRISEFFKVKADDLISEKPIDAHLIQIYSDNESQVKHTPKRTPKHTPNYDFNLSESSQVNEKMYSRVPSVVTVDRAGQDTIAYVPIKARAGYLAGYQDPEFISTLPTYSFPGMQNATFRMFEIDGHSMIPTFDDSDIVIGRFVENLSQIRNDRVHIIVTNNDGILIKRVINRAESDGKLILNSDNQKDPRDYPPIVLNIEEVAEVWYAVARFTRQMRAPGDMYNRLIDLEARLTLLEHSQRTQNLP